MDSGQAHLASLKSGIVISNTQPGHAQQLEALQRLVFPLLADEERFKACHYLRHIEIFPEGQFVALADGQVVGMASTIRLGLHLEEMANHTFAEVIQGGWLTSHDCNGDWLYIADMGTHPQWRRRGIARGLCEAQHQLVRRLGLQGQVAVGMLNGYSEQPGQIGIEDYYTRLAAGELQDPTVTAQLRLGFVLGGLVKNYLHDPTCGNSGALIVLPAEKEVG